MRLIYATSFAVLGGGCLALAASRGGGWWAAAWPAASFLLVAVAYARGGPRWFGKGAAGRFSLWAWLLLGPFILFTWATWHLARLLSREPAGHEVAPGVWVGRRAALGELPAGTALVVDLTCEMWVPRGVSRDGRYLCLPTLDGTPPADETLRALVERAASLTGPIYIHCAQGRGRSAALAAALLIARGAASDVTEAEALLRKSRAAVRLNAAQRAWVSRVAGDLPRRPAAAPATENR